jgi:membrane-associated protease RseP (regulator of RpoE activity)
MPDQNARLLKAGKLLYPVFREYFVVEAIYHRAEDLIFKTTPRYPLEKIKDAAAKRALDAGFYVAFYKDGESVLIVAKDIRPQTTRLPWLNILLFVLTLGSMIFAYSYLKFESDLFHNFSLISEGLIFAAALMPILLFHEFGHYLAARRNKADVSLPYFIPAPTLIGTLGAIIKSRSPFRTRRELFDVGAAGPLAGFIPAIIILIIGFSHPYLASVSQQPNIASEVIPGNSLVFYLFRFLFTPAGSENILILESPIIFAGWVGLFVTMLNLMPVGQLDGGHIIYALFGKRIQYYLGWAFIAILAVLGIFWPGWFLWAFLALVIIKIKHPPTSDDQLELNAGRKVLGWVAIVLFVITFIPIPFRFVVP